MCAAAWAPDGSEARAGRNEGPVGVPLLAPSRRPRIVRSPHAGAGQDLWEMGGLILRPATKGHPHLDQSPAPRRRRLVRVR